MSLKYTKNTQFIVDSILIKTQIILQKRLKKKTKVKKNKLTFRKYLELFVFSIYFFIFMHYLNCIKMSKTKKMFSLNQCTFDVCTTSVLFLFLWFVTFLLSNTPSILYIFYQKEIFKPFFLLHVILDSFCLSNLSLKNYITRA